MISLGGLIRFSIPCQTKLINQSFRHITQAQKKSKTIKPLDQQEDQKLKPVSKSPQTLKVISTVIPQKKETTTTKNNNKHCPLCNQEFTTSSDYPLFLKSKYKKFEGGLFICVGCRNLFGEKITDKKAIDTIKITLLNSYKNIKQREKQLQSTDDSIFDNELFSHYLKSVRKSMKTRCIEYSRSRGKTNDEAVSYCRKAVPSREELKTMAIESKSICAVSGVLGTWKYNRNNSDWNCLGWDHVVPISKGGSFEKSNLQIVLKCINQVKGSNSMAELTRYLSRFK